jgi:diguanylate cyclase (GGDEF)-like protein/PAS domain S-box-containing protein
MLEANAAYAKMSGYSVDELVNMHASQLEAIEQSMEEMRAHIEKVIVRGYERFETRHRHKDGHEIDVEVSATFMPELQQFFVFIHDITKRKQAEAGLIESEASIRAILDNSPYLSWLKDIDGRYIRVNRVYVDYTGLGDIRQIIGKTDFDLWPKELAEKYRNDDAEIIATRQQKRVEEPSLDGGKMHWVETFKTPVIDQSGNLLGTTGFARDVTERKQAEQALAESESRFREIFNTVSDAIFIHDAATGRIIDVNRRMCEMYGLTREEALACGPDDLSAGTPPYSSAEATEKIHLSHTDGPQTFEWLARARDGHLFWVEVSLRLASICGNQRILATVRDITERKQAEGLIRNLAFYDALTQLPNRRLLNDRLGQSIAASKRSGHYGVLMFLDLDNFKPLNDTHGHGVGDLLLIEVANRLAGCVREVDTVARFGGDEFVVMLGELDADKAESTAQAGIIAEKIRSALAEPYLLKTQQDGKAETTVEHYCAASIGVVVFNSEARAEDIIKWADTAMYQAKERGRNQVHFFDSKS